MRYWNTVLAGCRQSTGKESTCNVGDPSLIPGSGRSPGEGIGYPLQYSWASLLAQMVENPRAMQETSIWSLGLEDPLEEGMTTHSSIFAWRIPMDRGALWTAVHGVAKSQTRLSGEAAMAAGDREHEKPGGPGPGILKIDVKWAWVPSVSISCAQDLTQGSKVISGLGFHAQVVQAGGLAKPLGEGLPSWWEGRPMPRSLFRQWDLPTVRQEVGQIESGD